MKARSILAAALVSLVTDASTDPWGDAPSGPFPALAAAPLVYHLVPDPLGASTWAEREIEAARLGTGSGTLVEEGAGADLLLSLHIARTPAERALEISEAPRDGPVPPAYSLPGLPTGAPEERRVLGALEAMGLEPEDLVAAPEMPAVALALADFLTSVDSLLFERRPRERGSRVASFRVVPTRYVKQSRHVPNSMLREDPEPKRPSLLLYASRITRSLYKVLLGVAIGILIWGFVRNSG